MQNEEGAGGSDVRLRYSVLKNLAELAENESPSEVAMEYYMMVSPSKIWNIFLRKDFSTRLFTTEDRWSLFTSAIFDVRIHSELPHIKINL